jgi:hypothetical protein
MAGKTRLRITSDRAKLDRKRLALQAMAVRARDVSPAWHALLDWFAEQEMEQFLSRGRRWGDGWAPLAQSTIDGKFRQRYPLDPLIRTGELVGSLTHRPFPVEHITPSEVVAGTDVEHATFHQRGTRFMPARELFDARRIRAEGAATRAVAEWILRGRQAVPTRARQRTE